MPIRSTQHPASDAPAPKLRGNTRKRGYTVTVTDESGKTKATVAVTAEGVRDALKKAYEKVSGWQSAAPEEL